MAVPVSQVIKDAVADPARPEADRVRDADRKPGECIALTGIHPGQKVAEMLPGGQGYRVRFLPPLEGFPNDDALADTARMNRWIEERIRENPAQYLWVHKRFKSRPPGEAPLY